MAVPLTPAERKRIDAVCGSGRRWKRGEWVRSAILEKLDREEREKARA